MSFPALHGNWVDLAIIAFVIFYVWEGWGKGFFSLFFDLLAFVSAFLSSLRFYTLVANLLVDNFSFPRGIANAAGFFILGIVLEQIFAYICGKILSKIPEKWQRHKINLVLSVIPLLGNAVVIVAFILALVLGLPLQSGLKSAIASSKIGGLLVSQTQNIEKSLSKIFGEAISDSLNFVTTGPISSREAVKLNFTQKNLTVDEQSESLMLALVNKERLDRGIIGLQSNNKLRDLAREYCRDMFTRGYFSHYNLEGESPFDRMKEVKITYVTAGENLAYAPSVQIAHQGLMDSLEHRENILNPDFGQVGIAVIDGGIYGKMFVQEFTD